MTIGPPSRLAARGRPARRRRAALRWLVRLVVTAVVFALGLAFGQALDDNPEPGATFTSERTLRAGTLSPPPVTATVTVTVDAR